MGPCPDFLIWIATRDLTLAADASMPKKQLWGADIRFKNRKNELDRQGMAVQWAFETMRDAWNDLAWKMANGNLAAIAAKKSCPQNAQFSRDTTGVVFPPENALKTAFEHTVFDGKDGPVLKPDFFRNANSWTEWHDVTFAQADIRVATTRLFPGGSRWSASAHDCPG